MTLGMLFGKGGMRLFGLTIEMIYAYIELKH
jgi:hypothetical protein